MRTIHQIWLPVPCCFTQMVCFCANVAVFQLLRPSVLTLYEMRIFMSRTNLTESTSLKISMENHAWNVPTKYYTQMQAKMWVCGVCHGFFIVWTQGVPSYYERVELDMEFCLNVVNNITLFYKSFVLPCLLGYRDIFDCPKWNKVILERDEILCKREQYLLWHLWHLVAFANCADLTMSTADALDSWVCQRCLVDPTTAIIIDSDDDLEFYSSRIRRNGYKHSQHSV